MYFLLLLLWWTAPALAEGFLCAGSQGAPAETILLEGAAAKPAIAAQSRTTGARRALVLFARFKGEPVDPVPSWAADLFNPDLPGSFSHFYDTMSFGKLQVRGEVAPRVYESAQPASAYLANDQTPEEDFGRFSLEVLRQADREIDFAQYDNDGPDGAPNSGDDDGAVDAVFLVLDRVPANLLLSEATGISRLGFTEVFLSSDTGIKGKAIQVFPGQGAIQQGRYFAEAVGAICHEYGHVLGLPDLYNIEFIGKQGVGPEEDSAGVGAWCLMGWGASGWNGNDGPNSFCAWSRMKLGWSPVISLSQEREQLELKDVGRGGAIYQLPVNDREVFLVEYRRREGNYYDRHIPGEGVLIWRLAQRPLLEGQAALQLVNLECADGRWRDAGYPLGKEPDSKQGSDNLDFWAHDAAYARAHGGNLGDATDSFDGVRFTAFTPETNPSSQSNDGQSSVRIEDIRIEQGIARMEVQTAPRHLAVENFRVVDASGDGFLSAGEEAELRFWVVNRGGTNVAAIKTALSTDDPLVEILHQERHLEDLEIGEIDVGRTTSGERFPRFRLVEGFAGAHTASLRLDLYAGSEIIGQHPFAVTAGAARQAIQEVGLIDSSGNRDGQAQVGEIVQLSITLADQNEAVLPALGFSVRALDTRVQQLGSPTVHFRMAGTQARSTKGPEFLLPSTLEAGAELPFELEVSGLGTWKDTVFVQVHEGGDQTPPRISLLRAQLRETSDLEVLLSARWIIDGSELRAARALFYSPQDTSQLAAIPLEKQGDDFIGVWKAVPAGRYLVAGEVEDAAGNRGRSSLLKVAVVPRGSAGRDSSLVDGQSWAPWPLPAERTAAEISLLTIAPSNPEILYAADANSLWRSEDGGQNWIKTGLMFDGLYSYAALFVDPRDPFAIYLSDYSHSQILKSRDGGQHWAPVPMPEQDLSAYLLSADTVLPGRMYGYSSRRGSLLISEDEGQSWRESEIEGYPSAVVTHPAAPQSIYLNYIQWGSDKPGILRHSSDGGYTWQEVKLDRVIRGISPDPRDPAGLYGAGINTIWYSSDQGQTWQDIGQGIKGGINGVQVHPKESEVVYAWGGVDLWISRDRGSTWKAIGMPGDLVQLAVHPQDPSRSFLILRLEGKNTLWKFENYGENLAQVEIYQEEVLAGAMVFNPGGQVFVASAQGGKPGTFTSVDGGSTWEWQPSPGLFGVSYGNAVIRFETLYVDPLWPQIMIADYALGFNQFVRSADGGQTWKRMAVGQWGAGGNSGVFPRIVSDADHPGVYYLGEQLYREVWRSTDFGETWETQGRIPYAGSRSSIAGLLLDPLDDETLYAAVEDAVWFSEDTGQQWAEIGPVRPGETVFTLEFHPADNVSMYAVTTGGIYLSEDRAQTWKPLFKPEGIRWISGQLRFDPHDPNHFYLVTSRYLYESGDAGQTWVEISQGFEGYPWFNDLAFDPFDESLVYVTTTWGVYKLDRTSVVTAVEETPIAPATFSLSPNYPNPFNPTTSIHFTLPQPGEAELAIYNLLGQRVATLVQGAQEAGAHQVVWGGRDEQGRELASGVYLCRLRAGGQVETRKLLLLR